MVLREGRWLASLIGSGRGAALVGILPLAASGCSTTSSSPGVASSVRRAPAQTATLTSTPTGALVSPGVVTKVLVFIEQNHSLSQMKSGMPYAFGLAEQFGYATGYSSIQHLSLPNYVAIAGGQTYGITNDNKPSQNPVPGTSVFGQAVASGKTAAAYVDGMTQICATSDGGSGYAVKHNPWAYFINERDICRRYDVPVDRLAGAIASGTLPNVGMVIPSLCNDAHDCPLGTADGWFKSWMTKIFDGPDWTSGHLAVVLTADEDDKSSDNRVLTVVIHPSQKGNVVASPLTHYSLTRLLEEVTGTPFLFGAGSATSMAKAFGLPIK